MGPLDKDFLLSMTKSAEKDTLDSDMFEEVYSSCRERTRSIRRSANEADNLWEDLGYMKYKTYIPYMVKFASQTSYVRKNEPCRRLTIDQKIDLKYTIENEWRERRMTGDLCGYLF